MSGESAVFRFALTEWDLDHIRTWSECWDLEPELHPAPRLLQDATFVDTMFPQPRLCPHRRESFLPGVHGGVAPQVAAGDEGLAAVRTLELFAVGVDGHVDFEGP